jgi:hydrogenase nickel incorporation protein HypA/HybF
MHELSIATSVLEAVVESAKGARVTGVGLRVGEVSGVDADSLRFCLEVLVSGTDLEPLPFAIEYCPRTNRCPHCERVFAVAEGKFACPGCGAEDTRPAGGAELEIAYLEIDGP